MRTFIYILLALAIGACGWFLGNRFADEQPLNSENSRTAASSDSIATSSPKTIRCQGKLEPASGLIRIVAPVGSRIDKITNTQIGSRVAKNEVLATLQSRKIRQKDLALAIARRADALKKVKYEKQQGKFNLDSAKLALAEANASEDRIATEVKKTELLVRQFDAGQRLLDRLQKISSNPMTSDLINQTDVEKQQLLVEQLRLQIEQANLELGLAKEAAKRAMALADNNVKTIVNSLENAEQMLPQESLDAAVEMAQLAYDMTEIKCPIDSAIILDIIVREGDSVTNQPIMVLGDTSEMHCIAEVNDQFLQLIDVEKNNNPRAKITSPAFSNALMGTVVAKGVMIGAPSLKDPNPFASVDRRTGNLTIKLDDAQAAGKLVNLQVDVEIEIAAGTFEAPAE